jgi:cytochrome c oxidase cbb3-type subunit I/II
MKRLETFSAAFLIAGLALFTGATLSLGIGPALMVTKLYETKGLPDKVPPEFSADYPDLKSYTSAILRGRDLYIREACWHCHSQYVRPVSNESLRYGPVSTPGEFETPLQMPQLLGTRRVGPDLSREAGKRSNDWHYAHLYQPTSVVPDSVMPTYPWYFTVDKDGVAHPTEDGKAIVAYLQVLGKEAVESELREQSSRETVSPWMPPQE